MCIFILVNIYLFRIEVSKKERVLNRIFKTRISSIISHLSLYLSPTNYSLIVDKFKPNELPKDISFRSSNINNEISGIYKRERLGNDDSLHIQNNDKKITLKNIKLRGKGISAYRINDYYYYRIKNVCYYYYYYIK